MRKYIFVFFLLLSACPHTTSPVVLTEDKAGNALTMAAIPESGSRKDVPADVAPRNVIAEVQTPTGGHVLIVKKPFHKAVEYSNAQAKAEGLTIVQPKDPWWKWPAIVGGALAFAALLYFLAPLIGLLRRFK